MTLAEILRNSDYKLSQFLPEKINKLETSILLKKDKKGNDIPYVSCLVRKKDVKLTPEEIVHQLYIMTLHNDFGYPIERMELEFLVIFGREKKRADIVIFDKVDSRAAYIIVEVKKPKLKDGKEQLHSYCNATGAPIGIWSNGDSISFYHRKDPLNTYPQYLRLTRSRRTY